MFLFWKNPLLPSHVYTFKVRSRHRVPISSKNSDDGLSKWPFDTLKRLFREPVENVGKVISVVPRKSIAFRFISGGARKENAVIAEIVGFVGILSCHYS